MEKDTGGMNSNKDAAGLELAEKIAYRRLLQYPEGCGAAQIIGREAIIMPCI